MKIKKWKEVKRKEKEIILFAILSILLIVGVFFYQSYAIFKANTDQDMIEGNVENMGDLEFAFYIDGDVSLTAPKKNSEYSFDSSSSKCIDIKTGKQVNTNISWDNEKWGPTLSNVDTTKTKCFLYFKKIYKEKILNEAIPDLGNGRLVPVKISETEKPNDIDGASGGKVTKADITSEWYSYTNKQWANAVILREGVTDTYQPGDEILQNDIESYFVWIPRYQYKLQKTENELNQYTSLTAKKEQLDVNAFYNNIEGGNQAKNHPFEIEFGSKESEEIEGYIVHPAFQAFDTNGLWVGKFETGYKDATNTEEAAKAENTNKIDKTKVIIKPNVYSWRNINVSNAFYTSYEYKRELESHMMKNTEWGAVAYLAHSIYGRCDNSTKTCEEVSINNESSYITGWSTTQPPTCGEIGSNESCSKYGGPADLNTLSERDLYSYYISESKVGSTTGNYTGIYDMAGGSWEYVMGVMQAGLDNKNPASGPDSTNNSGFKGPYSNEAGENETGLPWPSSKYYDLYDYSTLSFQYQRGILGDATKEMGPFYSVYYAKTGGYGPLRQVGSYNADLAYFVNSGSPWFGRGASPLGGTDTGVFAFHYGNGKEDGNASFRVVLAS